MKTVYLVLILEKSIEINFFGNKKQISIKDVFGFCPIYETLEQASKKAENGKYKILEIEVGK